MGNRTRSDQEEGRSRLLGPLRCSPV